MPSWDRGPANQAAVKLGLPSWPARCRGRHCFRFEPVDLSAHVGRLTCSRTVGWSSGRFWPGSGSGRVLRMQGKKNQPRRKLPRLIHLVKLKVAEAGDRSTYHDWICDQYGRRRITGRIPVASSHLGPAAHHHQDSGPDFFREQRPGVDQLREIVANCIGFCSAQGRGLT
jgi:hypothetical protein